MKKKLPGNNIGYALALLYMFFASSCVNTKNAVYFNNLGDSATKTSPLEFEPVIQKSDLLSIYVSSLNPTATEVFNTPFSTMVQSATSSAGSTSQSIGYLVSTDGNIIFPVLGSIHAAGLTKKQLTESISKSLLDKKLLIDPIVNIRFLNYRVTVLGEVTRPSVISVANEQISLLEAIGLAGDLTIFARRDNVMIIRDDNGKKVIKRINLNSEELFGSPYYYLKTNDVIYVEPNKSKVFTASGSQQWLPIAFSALSFLTILLTQVKF
jgi:polysaccharide export outer membrane protein